MKPIYQTRFGGSDAAPHEQGNCVAACLASIFEVGIDEVPDFSDGRHWWDTLEAWCLPRGVIPMYLSPVVSVLLPRTYYILGVKSRTLANPGDGHAVVARGYEVVHDPNPHVEKGRWEDYEPEDATFFLKWWEASNGR